MRRRLTEPARTIEEALRRAVEAHHEAKEALEALFGDVAPAPQPVPLWVPLRRPRERG